MPLLFRKIFLLDECACNRYFSEINDLDDLRLRAKAAMLRFLSGSGYCGSVAKWALLNKNTRSGILSPMRTIGEWQRVFSAVADRKFPDSSWGESERLGSIQEQLNDVKAALEVEWGVRQSTDHAHQDPDHRIAALIADILILAEERGVDIESELEKVLAWFEGRD